MTLDLEAREDDRADWRLIDEAEASREINEQGWEVELVRLLDEYRERTMARLAAPGTLAQVRQLGTLADLRRHLGNEAGAQLATAWVDRIVDAARRPTEVTLE